MFRWISRWDLNIPPHTRRQSMSEQVQWEETWFVIFVELHYIKGFKMRVLFLVHLALIVSSIHLNIPPGEARRGGKRRVKLQHLQRNYVSQPQCNWIDSASREEICITKLFCYWVEVVVRKQVCSHWFKKRCDWKRLSSKNNYLYFVHRRKQNCNM